jgi:hypothetical protein
MRAYSRSMWPKFLMGQDSSYELFARAEWILRRPIKAKKNSATQTYQVKNTK